MFAPFSRLPLDKAIIDHHLIFLAPLESEAPSRIVLAPAQAQQTYATAQYLDRPSRIDGKHLGMSAGTRQNVLSPQRMRMSKVELRLVLGLIVPIFGARFESYVQHP